LSLPGNLCKALEELANDEVIKSVLQPHIFDKFVEKDARMGQLPRTGYKFKIFRLLPNPVFLAKPPPGFYLDN
jgi:hypothetical protein